MTAKKRQLKNSHTKMDSTSHPPTHHSCTRLQTKQSNVTSVSTTNTSTSTVKNLSFPMTPTQHRLQSVNTLSKLTTLNSIKVTTLTSQLTNTTSQDEIWNYSNRTCIMMKENNETSNFTNAKSNKASWTAYPKINGQRMTGEQ